MVGLITTSLAGLFLPAMLVAGGATFAVAMMLKGPMLGAMEGMLSQMEAWTEVSAGLSDAFGGVTDLLGEFGGELDLTYGTLGGVNEMLKEFGFSLRDVIDLITLPTLGGIARQFRDQKKGNQGTEWDAWREGVDPDAPGVTKGGKYVPPPSATRDRRPRPDRPGSAPGGDAGDEFVANMRKGMDLMMKSMRQDLGPPATFGQDLASVWRNATLAGLNQDPIAAEQMKIMRDQLAVMERMLGKMDERGAQYQ